jgi:hypothetical protein
LVKTKEQIRRSEDIETQVATVPARVPRGMADLRLALNSLQKARA